MADGKGKQERLTSQKKIILDYLQSVKTHPSAEIVYRAVQKKLPQISKGTVYRNLKSLRQKGEILELAGEAARFDSDISPHSHLFCEECGEIVDIFKKFNIKLPQGSEGEKIGKINHYQIYFYGICKKCENRIAKKRR